MTDYRIKMPWGYKTANALGKMLSAIRSPMLSLDESTVCDQAVQISKLTDFGNPYFRNGLSALLASGRNDARLHPIGQFIFHRMVLEYLCQRLRLIETTKRSPDLFRKKIIPPVIITGLARSGTTFLHNMLATNPIHRAIPLWELFLPFPDPNRRNKKKRPQDLKH